MTEKENKRINISLYDQDLAELHQIGKDMGLATRSGTIRFLIKYFQRNETRERVIIRERPATYTTEPAQ
jgi:metal-responsive CopG/Arc/MetJ family transcriptional regulator